MGPKIFLKSIVKSNICNKKKLIFYGQLLHFLVNFSQLCSFFSIISNYGQLLSIIGNFGNFLFFFGPLKCIFGNFLVNYTSLVNNFGKKKKIEK